MNKENNLRNQLKDKFNQLVLLHQKLKGQASFLSKIYNKKLFKVLNDRLDFSNWDYLKDMTKVSQDNFQDYLKNLVKTKKEVDLLVKKIKEINPRFSLFVWYYIDTTEKDDKKKLS